MRRAVRKLARPVLVQRARHQQWAKVRAEREPILIGSATGWADPWSRGRRGSVLEVEPWQVTVALDGEMWRLDRRDIQALRVVGGADGA
jgi:hypothetical protein